MSAAPIQEWNEGLPAKAVKAVEGKFENANRHVQEGEQSLLRAGRELRIVLRTYLKGDKQRFTAAASSMFDRGPSAAYEYVQAADAEAHFADAVKGTGTDLREVGVRTWAKLDRFTGSDDAKAEGLQVIAAEAKAAKAEARKPFTNAGLAATIRAGKGEGEATGTDDDRRIGRIAGKYRDDLRHAFADCMATKAAKGDRAAFLQAVRLGVEWGSASGALTGSAITKLAIEWAADDKLADIAAKAADRKAKASAEDRVRVADAIAALRPDAKPKPKPTVAAQPKPAAPKRTRKAKAGPAGIAALTANATP